MLLRIVKNLDRMTFGEHFCQLWTSLKNRLLYAVYFALSEHCNQKCDLSVPFWTIVKETKVAQNCEKLIYSLCHYIF